MPEEGNDMKFISFFLFPLMFFSCTLSSRSIGWVYYKSNCNLLFSSGEYYAYSDGKLNLKINIYDIVKKTLPDIFLIIFFEYYNDGILVIANEWVDNKDGFNPVVYFITDYGKEPERIMELDFNYFNLFYIYDNYLFCYSNSRITAIDIEKREILWKKELGVQDMTVRNILVDMELQICVLASHDYYIRDGIHGFVVIAFDNPLMSKSFQGILLDVNIKDKLIYYFDYENGVVSYNYKNEKIASLLRKSEFPDVARNMQINKLYTIEKDEYIICFVRETKVFLVELLFPKSGAALSHYTYFVAELNDGNFKITGQVKFDAQESEHTQIKHIWAQERPLVNEGENGGATVSMPVDKARRPQ